eukprot:gene34260-41470_t
MQPTLCVSLRQEHRVIFVVPNELVKSFPSQIGYGDIKQYVMTYSVPMEIEGDL